MKTKFEKLNKTNNKMLDNELSTIIGGGCGGSGDSHVRKATTDDINCSDNQWQTDSGQDVGDIEYIEAWTEGYK